MKPQGDGWYVRLSNPTRGTEVYLGPFMVRERMLHMATMMYRHLPDVLVQQYTREEGIEEIAQEIRSG